MDFKRIKTLVLDEQAEILFDFIYNSSNEEIASVKDILKTSFYDILTGLKIANKEIGAMHEDYLTLAVKYALESRAKRIEEKERLFEEHVELLLSL
jgi:hypothetical protein